MDGTKNIHIVQSTCNKLYKFNETKSKEIYLAYCNFRKRLIIVQIILHKTGNKLYNFNKIRTKEIYALNCIISNIKIYRILYFRKMDGKEINNSANNSSQHIQFYNFNKRNTRVRIILQHRSMSRTL